MEQKLQFEHRLDPVLLAEIEEWEQQEYNEPEDQSRPVSETRTAAA